MTALKRYNGATLDGQAMSIEAVAPAAVALNAGGRVLSSGIAVGAPRAGRGGGAAAGGGVTRTVTFGGGGGGGGGRGVFARATGALRGGAGGRGGGAAGAGRGAGRGAAGRGAGRGRGRGGRGEVRTRTRTHTQRVNACSARARNNAFIPDSRVVASLCRPQRAPRSAADLDAELDSYHQATMQE
jgi:hypothetical protein